MFSNKFKKKYSIVSLSQANNATTGVLLQDAGSRTKGGVRILIDKKKKKNKKKKRNTSNKKSPRGTEAAVESL